MRKGINIQEYLKRNIKESTKEVLYYLLKNNYSLDYKPSYNVITFGYVFLDYDLKPDDFIFICNKYSKILQSNMDLSCMNNFRFSINILSKEYERSRVMGCCGFFDQHYHNPKTGTNMYLGFNYGH